MANETVLSHPAGHRLEARYSQGDSEAIDFTFEDVFLKYYDRVLAVLVRLVGDRAQAEELADDVFLKLHRQPPANREQNLGGWLYRIATNLGIDALRMMARRQRYEQQAGARAWDKEPEASPLDEIIRRERSRQVREVLVRLKPAQAQLLILRYSGFSYKELADVLGVQSSSIGTLLARAEADFEKMYRDMHQQKE